jgi:predicted outer membrane protein
MLRTDRLNKSLVPALVLSAATACGEAQQRPHAPPPATPTTNEEAPGVTMEQRNTPPPPETPTQTRPGASPRASSSSPGPVMGDVDNSPPPATNALDDAQVAGAIEELNDRALRLAQLGQDRAGSRSLRRIAHELVTVHTGMQSRLKDVIAAESIAPRDSSAQQALRQGAQREITVVAASGDGFDQAFVDAEIRVQQQALDAVQGMLGQVTSPALKAELEDMHAKIERNLRLARGFKEDSARR